MLPYQYILYYLAIYMAPITVIASSIVVLFFITIDLLLSSVPRNTVDKLRLKIVDPIVRLLIVLLLCL
jgi:hypothetical protein